MSLGSYGTQDVYLVNRNYQSDSLNGNPYYKKLTTPNKTIHAAGNRLGRNKKKEKETQQCKEFDIDRIRRKHKCKDHTREPFIDFNHLLRVQLWTIQQWDVNIPQEQLDEERAFRLSQGNAYETKRQQLIDSIKLQDLITRLPARALVNMSDDGNDSTCCISYKPICKNDAYTICTRCRAVCCWQVLSTWLRISSSCPVCRLDMSGCDIFKISYRNSD